MGVEAARELVGEHLNHRGAIGSAYLASQGRECEVMFEDGVEIPLRPIYRNCYCAAKAIWILIVEHACRHHLVKLYEPGTIPGLSWLSMADLISLNYDFTSPNLFEILLTPPDDRFERCVRGVHPDRRLHAHSEVVATTLLMHGLGHTFGLDVNLLAIEAMEEFGVREVFFGCSSNSEVARHRAELIFPTYLTRHSEVYCSYSDRTPLVVLDHRLIAHGGFATSTGLNSLGAAALSVLFSQRTECARVRMGWVSTEVRQTYFGGLVLDLGEAGYPGLAGWSGGLGFGGSSFWLHSRRTGSSIAVNSGFLEMDRAKLDLRLTAFVEALEE